MGALDSLAIGGGRAVVWQAASPTRGDTPSEDSALVLPLDETRGVLAVADGMGGLPSGRAASTIAVEALADCIRAAAPTDEGSLRSAILDGFESANRRILEEVPGSGTTLVVAEIHGSTVRPFHVGDSMAWVVGQRGKLKLQTLAHAPVAYAVEAGAISEREAMRHEERHVVTNALGSPEMRIELGAPLSLAARDTLLLASDGLSDNLRTGEIVDAVRCGPLPRVVERLCSRAMGRMHAHVAGERAGKPDDLTVIAYRRERGSAS